jgi:hypothetical protein
MCQFYATGCCEEHTGDVAIYTTMGNLAREIIEGRDVFRAALNDPEKRAMMVNINEQLLRGMG